MKLLSNYSTKQQLNYHRQKKRMRLNVATTSIDSSNFATNDDINDNKLSPVGSQTNLLLTDESSNTGNKASNPLNQYLENDSKTSWSYHQKQSYAGRIH